MRQIQKHLEHAARYNCLRTTETAEGISALHFPPCPQFTPFPIMHISSYFITVTLTLMCYVYAVLSGLVLSAALTSFKIA